MILGPRRFRYDSKVYEMWHRTLSGFKKFNHIKLAIASLQGSEMMKIEIISSHGTPKTVLLRGA